MNPGLGLQEVSTEPAAVVVDDAALPISPTRPVALRAGSATWRRKLTVALGLVWLLDAGLQFQPFMFTTAFPNQVIEPVGTGSPAWVSGPTHWAGVLMAGHINLWNSLFAVVQLAIAVGLLMHRTTKIALGASIAWALGVWWLGEGLGGILAGPVSPVMGLPGAVIIYALIAVLLWPRVTWPVDASVNSSVAETSWLGRVGSKGVWLLLWSAFAFETLRPANRSPSALHDAIAGMQSGEPGWVKDLLQPAVTLSAHHGTQLSVVLAVLFVLIAGCVFMPAMTKPGLVLTVVVAALIWVFGQALGGLATGEATDPNTGPLLALLALCYWPISRNRASS